MLTNVIVLAATLLPIQMASPLLNPEASHQPSHTVQNVQFQMEQKLTACGNSNTRQKGCGGSGRRFIAS